MRAPHGHWSGSGPVREIGVRQPQDGSGDGDRLRPGQDVSPRLSGAIARPGHGCLVAEPSPQVQGPPWARLDLVMASPQCSWELPQSRPCQERDVLRAWQRGGMRRQVLSYVCITGEKKRSFPQNKRQAHMRYLLAPFGSCYS